MTQLDQAIRRLNTLRRDGGDRADDFGLRKHVHRKRCAGLECREPGRQGLVCGTKVIREDNRSRRDLLRDLVFFDRPASRRSTRSSP